MTDSRLRDTLRAEGPTKWREVIRSADYTDEAKAIARELIEEAGDDPPAPAEPPPEPAASEPTVEPITAGRALLALVFLAMGGVLLATFLSSGQVPFWHERCLVYGHVGALFSLALFVWARDKWLAHFVALGMGVATAGLVGSFLDAARTSAAVWTVIIVLAATAAWYVVVFAPRRR